MSSALAWSTERLVWNCVTTRWISRGRKRSSPARSRPRRAARAGVDPAQLGRLQDRRLVLGQIAGPQLRTFGGGIAGAHDQLADAEREHQPHHGLDGDG